MHNNTSCEHYSTNSNYFKRFCNEHNLRSKYRLCISNCKWRDRNVNISLDSIRTNNPDSNRIGSRKLYLYHYRWKRLHANSNCKHCECKWSNSNYNITKQSYLRQQYEWHCFCISIRRNFSLYLCMEYFSSANISKCYRSFCRNLYGNCYRCIGLQQYSNGYSCSSCNSHGV